MALLDRDLRDWILSRPALTDIVGEGKKARVHAVRLPQPAAYPAIVISLVSSRAVNSMGGHSDLRFRRFQIDLYSDDLDEVFALGQAFFEQFQGWAGMMGVTRVGHALMLSERDLDEEGLEGDKPLFRRSQDWEIAETAEGA